MFHWIHFCMSVAIVPNCLIRYLAAETLEPKPHLLKETPLDKLQILNETGIVPNFLAKPPQHVLFGDYDGKEISWGNVFTREEIKKRPHYLDWPVNGTKSLYCLLMSGLDAPSKEKPTQTEFRHWLVGNIPGTDIEKGEEILSYVGAGNFYDEGLHRIAFFVFRQPGNRRMKFYERIKRRVKPISKQRGNTSSIKFAEKYSLQQAVAANFFVVDCDKPEVTTDYYAQTVREVPPDWQGIELHPRDFGFTFDLPGHTNPPKRKLSKNRPLKVISTKGPSSSESVTKSSANESSVEQSTSEQLLTEHPPGDTHSTSQPLTDQPVSTHQSSTKLE